MWDVLGDSHIEIGGGVNKFILKSCGKKEMIFMTDFDFFISIISMIFQFKSH